MRHRTDHFQSSPHSPWFARLLLGMTMLGVVGGGAACRSEDSVRVVPAAQVTGTYQLESVKGVAVPTSGLGAVLAGEIILASNGHAIRKVRYQLSGVAAERDYVSQGTFVATPDSIIFALVEDPARPELVWRPRAQLVNRTITLRYPDPADGPDIVEVYRGSSR